MKARVVATLVALSLGAAAGAVLAQQKPEVMVKQRQAVMTLQGKYIGPMAGMASGKVPYNAEVIRRNSGFLDNLSRMAWDGFDPSTKDVKSNALPVVFSDQGKFRQAASRLENEANKLYELSRGGDENAVKAQVGAVLKACNACHDDFRQKQ
jgi:cytochrome c556